MNCRIARRKIPLLIGDDLSPAEADPLEEHIAGCGSCQQHVEDLLNSSDALLTYSSESLSQRRTNVSVWNSVAEQLPCARDVARERRLWPQAALMTMTLVALVALGALPDLLSRTAGPAPSGFGGTEVGRPDAVHLPAGEYVRHYRDSSWEALEALDDSSDEYRGAARNVVGF